MQKKIKTILIILAAALLLALIVFLSVRSRIPKPIPSGTVGNTAGNANNGGMFCEYKDVVYFSNPYDGGALYCMAPDESGIKKLSAISVSNLNAGGDYLFFFQNAASGGAGLGYARTSHGICRCDLKGRNVTNLSKDLVFNMQLIDDSLYYLSSGHGGSEFYQLRFDRSEKNLLASVTRSFTCALADGTVYYAGTETNHYLYRYDTHSGSSYVVWEGNIWYPVYENGYIYYLDVERGYKLCRYSLQEERAEILTRDRVDCFNLAGGYIYYQKNDKNAPALMCMTLDGRNPQIVMQGNYTHICATSRYVYFHSFENDLQFYHVPVGSSQASPFDAALTAAAKYAGK